MRFDKNDWLFYVYLFGQLIYMMVPLGRLFIELPIVQKLFKPAILALTFGFCIIEH